MSQLTSDLHDYHAWCLITAELIRQKRFEEINVEVLAEELESMSNRERRELASRMVILIAHLLKWQFQPIHRSASWRSSIIEQRQQILREIKLSPSLKPYLPEAVEQAYPDAVEIATDETGLAVTTFPTMCPYAIEQLLDKQFLPN